MYSAGIDYNTELEWLLIGHLIKDNNLIEDVGILNKDMFYDPVCGVVFDAISKMINGGFVANAGQIASYIWNKDSENFMYFEKRFASEFKVQEYLLQLSSAFGLESLLYHSCRAKAEQISMLYHKRQVMDIAKQTLDKLGKTKYGDDIMDTMNEMEKVFSDTICSAPRSQRRRCLHKSSEIINRINEKLQNTIANEGITEDRLSTGFKDLDNLINGFKNGELIILAARPSMGKTALATNMMVNIARNLKNKPNKQNKHALLFSLEMTAEQIVSRIVSSYSKFDSRTIETGMIYSKNGSKTMIDDVKMNELTKASNIVAKLPFLIEDSSVLSIQDIRKTIRKLYNQSIDISVLFVDYLQLLYGSNRNSRLYNRIQEISEITQGLKTIAKEFQIPVVALSQLSRAVESREDKRPQLSDLRDSGTIEQDADIVMFLYREAYYKERQKPSNPDNYLSQYDRKYDDKKMQYDNFMNDFEKIENLADVIVGKNRNGQIGNITLTFDKKFAYFQNKPIGWDPF